MRVWKWPKAKCGYQYPHPKHSFETEVYTIDWCPGNLDEENDNAKQANPS